MLKVKSYQNVVLNYSKNPQEINNDFVSDFEKILPSDVALRGDDVLTGVGVDNLLSEIFSACTSRVGEVVEFFLLLLGIGLLAALCDVSRELFGVRLHAAMRAGISAISALLIFSRLEGLVLSVEENLGALSGFFSSLVPILAGISLASGAVTTAGIQAVNMNLTLTVIGKISSELLMPLVFMIFALALVSSVGDGGMAKLAGGVKSVFLWALGILSTVLIASISMQSFIAASRDNATLRAAKYAITGSIPIVGSTVSGALSTLSGALSEASAVIGAGAVAVVFIMAAAPIVIMLLYRLALSVSMWLFEFVGSDSACSSYSAFRSALDILISLYAVSAVVYVLEITIFIKSGVNVFV